MKRFAIFCVLAVLATCGHAADTTMYFGPDGQPLKAGKYWAVTIHSDGAQPTSQLVLDVGGTTPIPPSPPVPPVPPTPPVDAVTAQIQALIATVTADPKKEETSKGISIAYQEVLKLTADQQNQFSLDVMQALDQETLVELVEAGVIKDAPMLRKVAETIIDQLLASPQVGKTATWKPFTDGMKALAAPMDFAAVRNAYLIAQAQLSGGPIPPPVPPTPPPGPTPPGPPPIPIPTAGLHVLVIDDENSRGHLPQSQINIFTSKAFADYLDKACVRGADGEPAYRFSSNDSLVPGGKARELELPVWVQGWDAVMKAVNDGAIKMPAWAITNGNRGVIEALPLTVEAAIARVKEFE